MDPGWGAVGDVVGRVRRARPQAECGGGQGFPLVIHTTVII